MEGRETTNSGGITVVRSDTPSDYHVAPRSENFSQLNGSPAVATAAGVPGKKKRGRPKKYGPDGSVTKPLSPTPISSAPPSIIDFSAEHPGKVRPAGLANKKKLQSRIELESAGEWVSFPFGANFTPHIITVNAGEDVTMKLISFSQQGPQAICILSANGVISSVTLRHPDSCGGTLTYEGSYQILSLTGSFMPSESGGIRSRSGGMSVLLVSPDGRLVGGGVAGLLLASSPVQIIVGSFFTGNQQEQRIKKHKTESINIVTPTAAIPISRAEIENTYGGQGNTHQLL